MAAESILQLNPPCLDNTDISNPLYSNLFEIDFRGVNQSEEKQTQHKYESLGLFKAIDNPQQKSLWILLSVGRKYRYPQLLLLLFSDYSRERIKHFIKTKQLLSINNWKKISQPIREILSSPRTSPISRNVEQIIYSSINIFQKRLCSPINFNLLPQEKINDSFLFFAKHILNGIQLIKNKNFRSQCQLDIWIIPDKIGEEQCIETNQIDSDDFDADESDSDSECENETVTVGIECMENNNEFDSTNIEQHIRDTIDSNNYVIGNNYQNLKGRFMNKLVNNYNNTANRRYCMIVQKGKKVLTDEKQNESEEEIYMYVPKYEYNIPNDNICEWGIHAVLKDILPKKKGKYCKISGSDSLNGKMFVLSLQKDEENEIRGWLYHMNTISRFYASDILNILPNLFVDKQMSRVSKKHYDHLKYYINKNSIPDNVFDEFTNYKHNKEKICSYKYLLRNKKRVIKDMKMKPVNVSDASKSLLNNNNSWSYSEQDSESSYSKK